MRRTRKLIIWIISVIVILFIALFIVASIYINHYKPTFEKILTENIGLETKIDGNISMKITPGLSFIADDVKVISNETYVFKIKQAEIAVDYLKIFNSNLDISALRLTQPQVYIHRDSTGKFNFESDKPVRKLRKDDPDLHELNLSELSIKNGRLLYVDMYLGDTLMVDGINLQSDKVGITGNLSNIQVDKIMFDGTIKLKMFRLNMLSVEDIEFKIDGRGGKMAILPVENNYFEGKNTGKAILDFTQDPTYIEIQHQLTGFNLGYFADSVLHEPVYDGKMDAKLDISFSSFNWEKAKKSLGGTISISGDNLTMKGIDIDKSLKKFSKSQNFDVVALGSLFIAGPYGAVLAKGINRNEHLNQDPDGMTTISKLVSNWRIINGIANSQDVAISTKKYRLCLTGGLNFKNDSYSDVTISLLNKKGCAVISEKISGPFNQPETRSQGVSGMITSPIENLWKDLAKPSKTICTPVYSGTVEYPL